MGDESKSLSTWETYKVFIFNDQIKKKVEKGKEPCKVGTLTEMNHCINKPQDHSCRSKILHFSSQNTKKKNSLRSAKLVTFNLNNIEGNIMLVGQ